MRTTIDIDTPLLTDLKRLQKREGKTLGRLISDLLAESLAAHKLKVMEPAVFTWTAQPMGARLDLDDKHALLDALDERPATVAPRKRTAR